MEFLKKFSILFVLTTLTFTTHAAIDGVVLRDGLDAEVIYDGSADGDGNLKIGLPAQMAIDPKTGELYFGNDIQGEDSYIFILNPETGVAKKFPFFGNGVAFNKDGSRFYFGLANLMLGVWYRDINEFRKFTILPGVESVQVVDDGSALGKLLVANSDYGKNILGVDNVWEVDQSDGFYQPAMRYSDGSNEVGVNFAALDSMAVDGAGNIYTLTGQGKVLIRKTDGSYQEGNTAPVTVSGLMQGGMGPSPDGTVYMQDTGSGEVFAYFPDGSQVLLAYGDPFRAAVSADGGITSDGQSIYLVNDKGLVIRIFSVDGSPLLGKLNNDLGASTLNGIIKDSAGNPLEGVNVSLRDKSVTPVVTDANGQFQFSVAAGLYHVKATLPNYGDFNSQVVSPPTQSTDLEIGMASFLPGYLAPGLEADIIATKSADSISGSSDVTLDKDGNVYSLNHSNGTITKTILDPETRDVVETFIAARGGGISNAWCIAVGDDLNMYTSSSNSGLLRLPPADPASLIALTVDPENPRIVRDQNGVDRMVSYVTDIDGATKMSNGDIMFTSGSGGSIIDGFPEGTNDSLIRYNPDSGSQTLFSRGVPQGGGSSSFNNVDVLKADKQDNLYVTNKGGNVVLVDTAGNGRLVWPGSGEGYPEGLSSYTAFNSDSLGNMFFKGSNTAGVPIFRMLDPSNDRKLLTVASELSPSSGFGGFEFDEDGRSAILSEWNFVLRIRSKDGRSIAENIVNPPSGAKPTINPGVSLKAKNMVNAHYVSAKSHQEVEDFTEIDPATVKLPERWAFENNSAENPVQNTPSNTVGNSGSSSGGGAFNMIFLFLLILFGRRQLR